MELWVAAYTKKKWDRDNVRPECPSVNKFLILSFD